MSPQRSDFILAADVPHCEADVFELNGFNIESDRGNGSNNFTQLQFVQDRGLTRGIQPHHQNSHFFLAEQRFEKWLETSHGSSESQFSITDV